MSVIQSLIGFLGRALLSLIFLASGINQILNWDTTLQLLQRTLNDSLVSAMQNPLLSQGIEWAAGQAFVLLVLAVVFQLLGGLMVFLGINTRFGAMLLLLFVIAATGLFHQFWALQGADRDLQMIMFLKNVSIAGGLLFIIAYGNGRCTIKKQEAPAV
ncbi:MAG: DoxX family protein [Chlamydiota bacterium]